MRTKIINSLVLCSIILMCNNSFGQGPGAFDVANDTDCDIPVTVWSYNGSCTGSGCVAIDYVTGTAYANTTTRISNGAGVNGDIWGRVSMDYGGVKEEAGPCSSGSNDGATCNDDDIKITFDNCVKAFIEVD